jgi:16S rRNA (guanine527-N7)-methyltransferase
MTPPPGRDPLPTCVNGLEPLPEAYRATIRAGLEAALRGAAVGETAAEAEAPSEIPASEAADTAAAAVAGLSEAQLDSIGDHVRLLIAWNKAINLSGIREPEMIAREHVLDSLTALRQLRWAGIDDFVDLGSGGGYPGIPLAIALPARRALLVDSVAKKARFLTTVVEALGIGDRVGVFAGRSEALAADPDHRGRWGAVLARAVADLAELAEVSLPLLRVGGILVAFKRRPIDAELAAAEPALRQLRGRLVALEDVAVPGLEDHVLAVVEKMADTPREFPRDPAVRRRSPL